MVEWKDINHKYKIKRQTKLCILNNIDINLYRKLYEKLDFDFVAHERSPFFDSNFYKLAGISLEDNIRFYCYTLIKRIEDNKIF